MSSRLPSGRMVGDYGGQMPRSPLSPAGARSMTVRAPRTFALERIAGPLVEVKQAQAPVSRTDVAWQRDAYAYVASIGEVGYGINNKANTVGQCRLSLEHRVGYGRWETVPEDEVPEDVARIADEFQGPIGGQGELLRAAALHLDIAGEGYLLGTPMPEMGPDFLYWEFLSVLEVRIDGPGRIQRLRWGAAAPEWVDVDGYIARMHRRDAMNSARPDSPMRRVLPICVAEGELVYGPDGPRPIEAIRRGDLVWSWDEGRLTARPVSRVIANGVKPVVKVRTGRRTVRVTADHRMLVMRENRHGRGVVADQAGLASAIRSARAAAGMTQESLAAAVGVDATTVCRWESGGHAPGEARVGALVEALGVDVAPFYAPRFENEWVEAGRLQRGDRLVSLDSTPDVPRAEQLLPDGTPVTTDVAWFIGAMIGDGTVDPAGIDLAVFDPEFAAESATIVEDAWGMPFSGDPAGVVSWHSTMLADTMSRIGLSLNSTQRVIPTVIWQSSQKVQRAFLDGYARADGHRPSSPTAVQDVMYAATSRRLIEEVRALHIALGDGVSNVSRERRNDGHSILGRPCNALDLWRFEVYKVDRRDPYRGRRPKSSVHFGAETVLAVDADGESPVWDITVPGPANFVAEGLVAHNCAELVTLTQVVDAISRTRLNAGVWFVPWEVSFGPTDDTENPGPSAEHWDEFEEEMAEHFNDPIVDRSSPASLLPLAMRGPATIGDKPTLELMGMIDLTRPLDDHYRELREEARARLADGLDWPREVTTGKGNMTHWNANNIDADYLQRHVQPEGVFIADFATAAYLQTRLAALGNESPRDWRWTFDISPVAANVDSSQGATEAYIADAYSEDAWLRALGLDPADKPSPEERLNRILLRMTERDPRIARITFPHLFPDDGRVAQILASWPEDIAGGEPDTAERPGRRRTTPGRSVQSTSDDLMELLEASKLSPAAN